MLDVISTTLHLFKPLSPYLIISATVATAYCYALRCGFVSDDLQGILNFDGKLQGKEYGMISRWLRYHLAGGNFPSKTVVKKPDGTDFVVPQGKQPMRHHLNIILVFLSALFLTYHFLSTVIGSKLALLSICLFAVHPTGVQAVAWCSAMGYPLSLLWIGAMLNWVPWVSKQHDPWMWVLGVGVFCLFQFLGIHAQFIPMMTCVILWFLGYKAFAVLGAIISAIMLFDIIKQTIDLRASEFKKQQMGESTKLHWRKGIVAMKTFVYYLALAVWPNKMGLYHKWGFHYNKDLERADFHFWLGLAGFLGLVGIFFLTPLIPVKLAILWFIAFLFIFLNWVTIQQFVTERYLFIPVLGYAILISYLTLNYPVLYALMFGCFITRLWLHLPTYDNELRFYQSNHWNFPDSEVALGNLGVTYINMGAEGTAMDTWNLATNVNKDYDVPWFNMFSTLRTRANLAIQNGDYAGGINQLRSSLPFLEKTISSKVCHFPDQWKEEHKNLLAMIQNPQMLLFQEANRLMKLDMELKARMVAPKDEADKQGILLSLQNNSHQLARLNQFMRDNGLAQPTNYNIQNLLDKLTGGR